MGYILRVLAVSESSQELIVGLGTESTTQD